MEGDRLPLDGVHGASGDGRRGAPAAASDVVSKSEYARMRSRSPAAISHWIRDGRLHGPAFVGVGRSARVVVAEADRQLARLLDPSQQAVQPAAAAPDATVVTDRDKYLEARARREQLEVERAELRMKAEQRQWFRREDIAAEVNRQLDELRRRLDELAQREAEMLEREFGLPVREATLALRRVHRTVRREVADGIVRQRRQLMEDRASAA